MPALLLHFSHQTVRSDNLQYQRRALEALLEPIVLSCPWCCGHHTASLCTERLCHSISDTLVPLVTLFLAVKVGLVLSSRLFFDHEFVMMCWLMRRSRAGVIYWCLFGCNNTLWWTKNWNCLQSGISTRDLRFKMWGLLLFQMGMWSKG